MIVPNAISIGHKIRSLRPCTLYGRPRVGNGGFNQNGFNVTPAGTWPSSGTIAGWASTGLWYTKGWYDAASGDSATSRAASIRLDTPNCRMAPLILASTVWGETPMILAISLELRCSNTSRKVST